MALIQIKVIYNYYSNKRITPVYMPEEELENYSFEQFKLRIVKEVPHLAKASSLRWTVDEDRVEVDLSPIYFNYQVRGLLQKEKSININVIEFESPAACTSSHNEGIPTCSRPSRNLGQAHARRTLVLDQNKSILTPIDEDTDGDTDQENEAVENRVVLPLERYAIKQKETVDSISQELKTGIHELEKFDKKILRASSQNMGSLSMCGKCHLKLGHTKKICTFSPCKSAFSCGQLSKHMNEKAQRTSIEKDIGRLRVKLTKAQKDVDDAGRAAEKLSNSASRRIEDVVINEMPDRYVVINGLRNWSLLNRDVATLQKHLKGKLPSRENVQKLLHDDVIGNVKAPSSESLSNKGKAQRSGCTTTKAASVGETDHRMSSQKRVLSEDYAITFPMKRAFLPESSSVCASVCASDKSEMNDFKLALKLQQEEMESPQRVDLLDEEFVPDPVVSTPASNDTVCQEQEDNIEFEADAAAALLQLKRRR